MSAKRQEQFICSSGTYQVKPGRGQCRTLHLIQTRDPLNPLLPLVMKDNMYNAVCRNRQLLKRMRPNARTPRQAISLVTHCPLEEEAAWTIAKKKQIPSRTEQPYIQRKHLSRSTSNGESTQRVILPSQVFKSTFEQIMRL
jgi:hypothetical protein